MPDLTGAIVESLLPPTDAGERFPVGVTASSIEAASADLTYFQRRIFRWTTVLQARIESELWERQIPGFQYATYGFVPVSAGVRLPSGVRTMGGFVFGVALEMEAAGDGPLQEAQSFEQNGVTVGRILNWRTMERDVANPIAPRGTGACWARSKNPAIWPAADGVLTAAHVVAGVSLRSSVAMSDRGSWNLGDRGSCKIDAALIVQAGCIPVSSSPLRVQFNPLPSRTVTIYGAASAAAITARITHAQVHPTYLSADHPMRVFFDRHGIAGDSGALVLEGTTGLGVGVYMGRYPIPPSFGAAPIYEGGAQALSQAQHELQLDLFI
jgi:hypothetical protein